MYKEHNGDDMVFMGMEDVVEFWTCLKKVMITLSNQEHIRAYNKNIVMTALT